MKKRKYPPAFWRYVEKNPNVICSVPLETKQTIKSIVRRDGGTIASWLRNVILEYLDESAELTEGQKKTISNQIEKEREKARKEGLDKGATEEREKAEALFKDKESDLRDKAFLEAIRNRIEIDSILMKEIPAFLEEYGDWNINEIFEGKYYKELKSVNFQRCLEVLKKNGLGFQLLRDCLERVDGKA